MVRPRLAVVQRPRSGQWRGEAGLAGRGDLAVEPAGHLAVPACRSMPKSWMVNPPGTALDGGIGLIVWVWPAARRAARVCPAPSWLSPSTSSPGCSSARSPTPVGPSGAVAAVSAHSVTSPVSGSAAMWPLSPSRRWALVLRGYGGPGVDGGDHPVVGDPPCNPPRPGPLARLDVLAGDQCQQRDRLRLPGSKLAILDRRKHRQRVVDQPRHQRLGGLRVVPGAHRLARPPIVVGLKLDLADRVNDPPRPIRGPQPRAPGHQHRQVEPLVIQPQPTDDLPDDIAPQRADRSRSDRPARACSTITVAITSAGTDGCPPRWRATSANSSGGNSWRAMVGQEGGHRPLRDRVTTPACRVQLGIGAWRWGT
jgi:hypothetical protein